MGKDTVMTIFEKLGKIGPYFDKIQSNDQSPNIIPLGFLFVPHSVDHFPLITTEKLIKICKKPFQNSKKAFFLVKMCYIHVLSVEIIPRG